MRNTDYITKGILEKLKEQGYVVLFSEKFHWTIGMNNIGRKDLISPRVGGVSDNAFKLVASAYYNKEIPDEGRFITDILKLQSVALGTEGVRLGLVGVPEKTVNHIHRYALNSEELINPKGYSYLLTPDRANLLADEEGSVNKDFGLDFLTKTYDKIDETSKRVEATKANFVKDLATAAKKPIPRHNRPKKKSSKRRK